MKDYRRSLLQVKILIQLEEKPANSITELAEQMGAQRPSVSRSVRILKEQGLVYRNRQGWHLTEAGKTETSNAKEKLAETTEKLISMVTNVGALVKVIDPELSRLLREARWHDEIMRQAISPEIFKSISLLSNGQIASIVKQINEVVRMSPALDAISQQMKQYDQAFAKAASSLIAGEFYERAIKPLLEIQERNGEIFQKIIAQQTSPGLEAFANQNNLYMTKAINDILAIRRQEFAHLADNVRRIDFSWLVQDLSRVNQAYSRLFAERTSILELSTSYIYASQIANVIMLPTATVSYFADSARNHVEAETGNDIPDLPEKGYKAFGDESLDPLLYQFNPDFVKMRQGSWFALSVAGPDRLRHAATSQRELIRQILELFIPNALLSKDSRQGPQLKARLRIALEASESDAEYLEAMSVAVIRHYDQLNKYTHHNEKHEESLRALIQTGEGLIRFILTLALRRAN